MEVENIRIVEDKCEYLKGTGSAIKHVDVKREWQGDSKRFFGRRMEN